MTIISFKGPIQRASIRQLSHNPVWILWDRWDRDTMSIWTIEHSLLLLFSGVTR